MFILCFISEITCPNPQNPENGFVTYTTLHYGSELEYKCDKGFHLNTEEIVFCTSDGKWSNTNVQCIGNYIYTFTYTYTYTYFFYLFTYKYVNIYQLPVSAKRF